MEAEIIVPGIPEPKGSHFAVRRGRFNVILNGGNAKAHERHADWTHRVKHYATATMRANAIVEPCSEPCAIDLTFYMPRPPSAKKRLHCAVKPDLDKLCRSAIDGLAGIVMTEDSRIVSLSARKVYSDEENPPGVSIRVWSV